MNLDDRLAELPPDVRAAVLSVLDEISRPLTNREIDDALFGLLSRRDRRALVKALSGWSIIALERN